jgi:predicted O-methyltransferase YrrM
VLGGRVVSLEHGPEKCAAWRENVRAAGLEEWAELVEGDAFETLGRTRDVFDLVFLDAEKDDYEALFGLIRPLVDAGGLVVADNVLSHADPLAAYSAARQADPALVSVTLPLDRGLELTVALTEPVSLSEPRP